MISRNHQLIALCNEIDEECAVEFLCDSIVFRQHGYYLQAYEDGIMVDKEVYGKTYGRNPGIVKTVKYRYFDSSEIAEAAFYFLTMTEGANA